MYISRSAPSRRAGSSGGEVNTLLSLLRWFGGRLVMLAVLSAALIAGYGVREYLSRPDTSLAQMRRSLDLRREGCLRMMRDLQRLNREIADLLQKSEKSVANALGRAVKKIRRRLSDSFS